MERRADGRRGPGRSVAEPCAGRVSGERKKTRRRRYNDNTIAFVSLCAMTGSSSCMARPGSKGSVCKVLEAVWGRLNLPTERADRRPVTKLARTPVKGLSPH